MMEDWEGHGGGAGFIVGVTGGHWMGNGLICLLRKLNERTARKTIGTLVRKLLLVQERNDRGLDQGKW